MSKSADVVITTVTSLLIITSIVGSCLVCAVIKRNREMRYKVFYMNTETNGLRWHLTVLP